jgi:hypothetical protein
MDWYRRQTMNVISSNAVEGFFIACSSCGIEGGLHYISQNLIVIGSIIIPLIWFVMEKIKEKFPNWNKKAWAPPVIGMILFSATGLVNGQIETSWYSLISYIVSGAVSGGLASSIRDVVKGK